MSWTTSASFTDEGTPSGYSEHGTRDIKTGPLDSNEQELVLNI